MMACLSTEIRILVGTARAAERRTRSMQREQIAAAGANGGGHLEVALDILLRQERPSAKARRWCCRCTKRSSVCLTGHLEYVVVAEPIRDEGPTPPARVSPRARRNRNWRCGVDEPASGGAASSGLTDDRSDRQFHRASGQLGSALSFDKALADAGKSR